MYILLLTGDSEYLRGGVTILKLSRRRLYTFPDTGLPVTDELCYSPGGISTYMFQVLMKH